MGALGGLRPLVCSRVFTLCCSRIVPPALWAMGGLTVALRSFKPLLPQDPLGEGFTPSPTPSPGTKMGGFDHTHRLMMGLLGNLGRFFSEVVFSMFVRLICVTFWLPKWTQHRPKTIKNRCQNAPRSWLRFLIDVSSTLVVKADAPNPQTIEKSLCCILFN